MRQPKTTALRSKLARRLWPRYFVAALVSRLTELPVWKRVALVAALAPVVLGGGASGAYYLNLHRVCREMSLEGLPRIPSPVPPANGQQPSQQQRRILVIAPHCDDETLGAGGLIADARRAGVPVAVAFLTNGDGFRVAASRALHEVDISPSDYVRFAGQRQEEALAALRELGVPGESVFFFGYPDRGLKPMWEEHWASTNLYRSAFTRHTHVPYTRAFTRRAPYCGEQVHRDMVRLLHSFRPTDIYVTHPSDDHPDHHAAAAFAQAALYSSQREGATHGTWAKTARLRYYIVHRGDWPLPQGGHPDLPLLPPPGMVGLDTRWAVYDISQEGRDAKARALASYVSQITVSGRFLTSFKRVNELFGSLAEAQCHPQPLSGGEIPPAATVTHDAHGDNVARFADPAADLTGVTVQPRPDGSLRVRLQTRGPVSSRLRYRVLLRFSNTSGSVLPKAASSRNVNDLKTGFVVREIRPRRNQPPSSIIETTILPSELSSPISGGDVTPDAVWISAETRWAGRVTVDRTGYRLFRLDSPGQVKAEVALNR